MRLGRGIQAGVLLVFALLVFGWIQVPSAAPLVPAAVLIAYAVFAHFGLPITAQGNPKTPWITAAFGMLSGAVLVPSLLVLSVLFISRLVVGLTRFRVPVTGLITAVLAVDMMLAFTPHESAYARALVTRPFGTHGHPPMVRRDLAAGDTA